MSVSDKVKALIKMKGKDNSELAKYLGISDQALSNKFYRGSFSAEDLIKIADCLDYQLIFMNGDDRIELNIKDIRTQKKEQN